MDIDIHIRRVENELSRRHGVVAVENANIERLHENRAVINVRLVFSDESFLDVHETVDTSRSFPQWLLYSYQYMRNGQRVFRYDNSRHHPELDRFPEHKHLGRDDDGNIVGGERPSHNSIFKEINRIFRDINRYLTLVA